VYPAEDDVMFWQVLMQGPEATPYAHGVFRLWVQFPTDYPVSPPDIHFITPIFHCNISDTGKICHSIIRRHYSSTVDISFIFQNIWSLLSEPTPDDPLDSNRALLYWTDKANYLDQAHAHTLKNSEASCMADAEERLLNPASHRRVLQLATVHAPVLSPGEPPPELLCPLTLQLFQDPVLAKPTGIHYERNAILTHLRHGNSFDPVYMSRFNTCIVLSEALVHTLTHTCSLPVSFIISNPFPFSWAPRCRWNAKYANSVKEHPGVPAAPLVGRR
jgi:ubiquitin-conjugating enzyme E2 D/E